MLALTAAAYIASADLVADEALAADKVWDAACAADSPLLAPATASKLAAEDAGAAAQAAEVLLTLHARRLGGETSGAAAAAARSLGLLLLRSGDAAAADAAAAVSATSPELAAALVAGLQHWASNPAAPEVAAVLGEAAAAPQARFAAAAVLATPAEGTIQLSAQLVSSLLLLAHHPSVGGSGSACWMAVRARLGAGVADVLAAAPAHMAAALITSPATGAASPELAQAAAARGALSSAMSLAAEPLFAPLMAALGPLLDSTAHDALSAREVKIYFTPAGEVFVFF